MRNDYNVKNVVKFIGDFMKQEEQFDSTFFERLSCIIILYFIFSVPLKFRFISKIVIWIDWILFFPFFSPKWSSESL